MMAYTPAPSLVVVARIDPQAPVPVGTQTSTVAPASGSRMLLVTVPEMEPGAISSVMLRVTPALPTTTPGTIRLP
jgi:hypothetical protein